jgi:hypothetical protein
MHNVFMQILAENAIRMSPRSSAPTNLDAIHTTLP